MKNYYLFILIVFLTISFSNSCEMGKCWYGKGENTIQYFESGYYYEVNARGMFDIILVQDSLYYIEFEGGSKILDFISVRVIDSVTYLDNSNQCNFTRDYERVKCYLHFDQKLRLNLFEPCKVASQNPVTSDLILTVPAELAEADILLNNSAFLFYNHKTSGGSYTFRGFSDRCTILGYYSARFVLSGLDSRVMHVNNSSIGDMHVNAYEVLNVEIHNKGNIYYSGSPLIVIDSITGSGNLLPEN